MIKYGSVHWNPESRIFVLIKLRNTCKFAHQTTFLTDIKILSPESFFFNEKKCAASLEHDNDTPGMILVELTNKNMQTEQHKKATILADFLPKNSSSEFAA